MVSFNLERYKMLLSENVRRFSGNMRVVQSRKISFHANSSLTHTTNIHLRQHNCLFPIQLRNTSLHVQVRQQTLLCLS